MTDFRPYISAPAHAPTDNLRIGESLPHSATDNRPAESTSCVRSPTGENTQVVTYTAPTRATQDSLYHTSSRLVKNKNALFFRPPKKTNKQAISLFSTPLPHLRNITGLSLSKTNFIEPENICFVGLTQESLQHHSVKSSNIGYISSRNRIRQSLTSLNNQLTLLNKQLTSRNRRRITTESVTEKRLHLQGVSQ